MLLLGFLMVRLESCGGCDWIGLDWGVGVLQRGVGGGKGLGKLRFKHELRCFGGFPCL